MASPYPTPLTPIEEFFLLDDQPGYPNHILCRLRFDGEPVPELAEQSGLESVKRHPMLVANVVRRGGRLAWSIDGERKPVLDEFNADDDTDYPPLRPIDPRAEQAGRFTLVRRKTGCDIVFQVHHAAMDGVGGLQALAEWLIAYHRRWTGDAGNRRLKLPRLDHQLLTRRARISNSAWSTWKQLPNQVIGAYGLAKYLNRRPMPLNPQGKPPQQAPERWPPSCYTHWFSRHESARMQRTAVGSDATVNGLMARDLFLAIGRWQSRRGYAPGNRCLRLMIPLNMRNFADRRLCAANRVSMVYLDRFARELRDPRGLLWGVNFEMRTIQRLNLGTTCLIMMALMSRIHGGLRSQVRADVCRSTCLMTNLAAPFSRLPLPHEDGLYQVGNLRLRSYDLLAPLRPQTSASFCIYRYAGRVGLSLHYDPWSLTTEGARELFDGFIAQLRASLAQGNG